MQQEQKNLTECPHCKRKALGEYRSVGGIIGRRKMRIFSYCHFCKFENVHELKITERDWANEVGLDD